MGQGITRRTLMLMLALVVAGWGVGQLVGRAVPVGRDLAGDTAARAALADRGAPRDEVPGADLTIAVRLTGRAPPRQVVLHYRPLNQTIDWKTVPMRPTGDDRERAILATFERLLGERGLHEISIDDIARGAGISRPTFYFYFASKEAVLLSLFERMIEEARANQGDALEREVGAFIADLRERGLLEG